MPQDCSTEILAQRTHFPLGKIEIYIPRHRGAAAGASPRAADRWPLAGNNLQPAFVERLKEAPHHAAVSRRAQNVVAQFDDLAVLPMIEPTFLQIEHARPRYAPFAVA